MSLLSTVTYLSSKFDLVEIILQLLKPIFHFVKLFLSR